jgi:hypothetical protein
MQFFVLSRRRTEAFTAEDIAPMIEPEAQTARGFYQEGFVRQIWHRADVPGAAMLVEADSLEAAKAKLATLPMYEAGMLELVMVVPLKPYGGFAPR